MPNSEVKKFHIGANNDMVHTDVKKDSQINRQTEKLATDTQTNGHAYKRKPDRRTQTDGKTDRRSNTDGH
jgi:hypothetical protein